MIGTPIKTNFITNKVKITFFSKLTFPKNSFRNNVRASDGLDPNQARQIVGSDLGPN